MARNRRKRANISIRRVRRLQLCSFEDASWHGNVQNVQIFPSAGFEFICSIDICAKEVLFWSFEFALQPYWLALYQRTSPQWELRTQKLRSHLLRTQSLKVLPLKLGVGQYTAIHAAPTVRDFFLANFYPSGPFTCIFSKTSPEFFLY